jgi:hypothetical protein
VQFWACTIANGGADAELIEQRETGRRQALAADFLSRVRAFLDKNHAPPGHFEQYRRRRAGGPRANNQGIGVYAFTHALAAPRSAPQ